MRWSDYIPPKKEQAGAALDIKFTQLLVGQYLHFLYFFCTDNFVIAR